MCFTPGDGWAVELSARDCLARCMHPAGAVEASSALARVPADCTDLALALHQTVPVRMDSADHVGPPSQAVLPLAHDFRDALLGTLQPYPLDEPLAPTARHLPSTLLRL